MICKRLLKSLFLIIICAGLFACATTKNIPQKKISRGDFNSIRENLIPYIEKELKDKKITGLSFAMVVDGKIFWQQGFGYADKQQKVPVTSTTAFRAGSLSKIINALAVIKLVEQGKVSLDTSIQEYIPELQLDSSNKPSKPITLRHLLSHQSGLPSDLIHGMWTSTPQYFSSVTGYINQHGVIYPPDTISLYSNLGFNMVGLIIERASGEDYESYMNNFLKQLGMPQSHFSSFPQNKGIAKAYDKGKPKQELGIRDVPAAGLSSNVVELAHIISLFSNQGTHQGKRLLQAQSLETLLQDHGSDKALNLKQRIGLGIQYFDNTLIHRRTRIVGHSGATNYHRALIKFSPEHKYGVVLMANSGQASPSLHKIANHALLQLNQAARGPKAARKAVFWPRKRHEDIIEAHKISGHYATKAGLVKVYQQGDTLKAKLAGKTFRLYKRHEDGLYYLKYKFLGLIPIKLGYLDNLGLSVQNINGDDILISRNTLGNQQVLGKRIHPQTISPVWQQRVGKYKIDTPLEVMDFPSGGIKIVDSFLVAYAKTERGNTMQFVLQPLDDNEAIVAGIGRGLGEKVISQDFGEKEALWYSTIRFIKE